MSEIPDQDSLSQELNTALHEVIRRGALPRVLRRLNDSAGATFDRSSYWLAVRLKETGGIRLSALADLQGIDFSTVSRQVQVCEKAGLVERQADPTDARATLVWLTQYGLEMLERMLAVERAAILDTISDWSLEDQAQFARLLTRFATRFHAWAVADSSGALFGGSRAHP